MQAQTLKKRTRRHAKFRAQQRFGLNLNRYVRKEIIQKIQIDQAVFLERESGSRSTFLVDYQDQNLIVVYSKSRQEIITLLPLEGRRLRLATVSCSVCGTNFIRNYQLETMRSHFLHPCAGGAIIETFPDPSWILQEQVSFGVRLRNIDSGLEFPNGCFEKAYKSLYEDALAVLAQCLNDSPKRFKPLNESILWIDSVDDYACNPPKRRVTFSSYLTQEN